MIHVLDAGQIVESGTHESLLDRGGQYAQSWFSQVEGSSCLMHVLNQSKSPNGMPE
jgi:ATP-binding cassette subfamily B protein